MTSPRIRYPSPRSCHASRFPLRKSLCLSICSIKCCKFCDEGQRINFSSASVSYCGATSMLLKVFDSYWRRIDDLNPPHVRPSLLTSLVLSHPHLFLFFFFNAFPIQFIKHAFGNQRLENHFHSWGRYSVSFSRDAQLLILCREAGADSWAPSPRSY